MFKWKVSGLGGGSSKKANKGQQNNDKLNNANISSPTSQLTGENNNDNNEHQQASLKNNKNNKEASNKSPSKNNNRDSEPVAPSSPQKPGGFRLFQSNQQQHVQPPSNNHQASAVTSQAPPQPNGILKNSYDRDAMSRVGQRLAMTGAPPPPMIPSGPTSPNSSSQNTTMDKLQLNLSSENIYRPANNPPKPGWRPQQAPPPQPQQEEAIPNDSLYNGGVPSNGSASWREKQFGSRPSLNGMAHWSSHGYLAKANDNAVPNGRNPDGYVVLKRAGDQMVTSMAPQGQGQPQSLPMPGSNQPPVPVANGGGERKYYSVKNYGDFRSKHNGGPTIPTENNIQGDPKYFSVDARYHSMKNLPPEIRAKLRENLSSNPYQAPPVGQFQQQQRFPGPPVSNAAPPVPSRPLVQTKSDNKSGSGNSVSWHEWTQQLQAYIAWVNSQLRKRPELRPVQDLRTDLQSGEVLAQLIEIISGEKIAGIQYAPESLQGMRENIERILQFMAAKRIRMHQITSKEVLEGNLKAVMRLILALAAHYKPQSVRHHDNSSLPYANEHQVEAINKNQNPPTVEDTTLNQTTENLLDTSTAADSRNGVKRSPSLNDGHYAKTSKSRLQDLEAAAGQIYENFSSSRQQPGSQQSMKFSTKATIESPPKESAVIADKTPVFQREGSFVMQREGSFVRTGSGRKLPKIPGKEQQKASTSELLNTSLPSPLKMDPEADKNNDNRKASKPKALEFWESLETVERSDFRYNTIHRMSVGRRMLPKAPETAARSQSLDRSECLKNSSSLNSSFEHDTIIVNNKARLDSESSVPSSPPPKGILATSKMAADGCSLQSGSSAQPSQPSPPSSDSRGEVEGSSDNNSPPTSVIQGKTNQTSDCWDAPLRNNPAFDWLRGGFKPGKLDDETLLNQLRQQRLGDGHSGSDSKHSDTMSDQGNIPYDILIQDLTQAKRQLLELHNLLMTNNLIADAKSNTEASTVETTSCSEFAKCVENINVLNLRLKNSEERCQLLRTDLRQAKQECATLEGSKNGLQSRLSEQELATSQLKQDLIRVTLAKQTLEYEKKELLRRVDELERGLAGVKSENGEKDKLIRAHKQQLEEFARKQRDFNLAASAAGLTPNGEPDLKALYDEEMAVAKDALSNLRSSFKGSDPNQHILDTLEQCISVIIEKIQRIDQERNGSRMSSLDYNKANESSSSLTGPSNTKILYFTNRSVTPFMSSISKKIGEITLRDFKVLFDRPGFYRFHFKSVDQEFGMVKEEISSDDMILPGADGKIVAWVEED